jgi:hypothetical protein
MTQKLLTLIFSLCAAVALAQQPTTIKLTQLETSPIVDGTRINQFGLTNAAGKQRYVTLDSLIVIIVDSLIADTTLQVNWYTTNGVTTDGLRTAIVKQTAIWLGLDTTGFIRHQMGLLDGSRNTVYQDSTTLLRFGATFDNYVTVADSQINIVTSGPNPQAVNVQTDTINWSSTADPTLQMHNLLADGTYFHADSLKVVGIGQFPGFPALSFDGTEKGYYYDPAIFGVLMLNGDGATGTSALIGALPDAAYLSIVGSTGSASGGLDQAGPYFSSDFLNDGVNTSNIEAIATNVLSTIVLSGKTDVSQYGESAFSGLKNATNDYIGFYQKQNAGNWQTSVYMGYASNNNPVYIGGDRAFGVRSVEDSSLGPFFDWLQIFLPNDTVGDLVSFYNRAYYWRNEMPTGVAGDTLFHFWAEDGTNAGKNPGFMTLDQVCAHCAEDSPNIFNSNGQQTDNTRLDTIRQTIDFFRLNTGSSFEPGFKVSARAGNRPATQGWYYNNNADSILMYKTGSDVAFLESASMPFGFAAVSDYIFLDGDSLILNFGLLANTDNGDILAVHGVDASDRTVKALEGTFNADQLSWNAGAAGDKWFTVPANRTSIATTSASIIPGESVAEILVDGAAGGTVELNYTPAMPAAGYTTYRYIYNPTAGVTTVDTDQAWQFRDSTGDIGTSFNLAAGENCKLIWLYDVTAADQRFFVIKF